MTDASRGAMNHTTRAATGAELLDLLGDVSPDALARLLATAATVDEVAAELAALEDEDALGEHEHAAPSPRRREIRAVLEELALERIDALEDDREMART
ncbi:MAG: hypothetical protein JO257_36880 [Deltaproteobacteria bacterium]|nr:hypothetical protein [Deltaproteobacteria bacterium]